MTGEAHWLDAALMIGGGVGIALYVWMASRSQSFLLRERMKFMCPVQGIDVGAVLLEDVRTDELTDIKYCSGWRHFWKPCQKPCLRGLNDGSIEELGFHSIHRRPIQPLSSPPPGVRP